MQVSHLFTAERLPRKPYCVDFKGSPLAIRALSSALKFRHIQPNQAAQRHWLVFDVDRLGAADAWQDAGLPPPNIAVINPANGHAHLFYALETPVCTSDQGRSAPLRYAAAVEAAYTAALGADAGFVGLIAKNPLHPDWVTVWLHPTPYTLGELAEYVELPKKLPQRSEAVGLGRNCSLFESLRKWAYRAIRKHRSAGASAWHAAVLAQAEQFNDEFPEPLPYSEAKATAKSVAKWVWQNCTDAGFSERQAALGRKGGQAKGKALREIGQHLLTKGASVEQVMADCGVDRTTVWRWRKAAGLLQ